MTQTPSTLLADGAVESWYGVYMVGLKVGHARVFMRPPSGDEPGAIAVGTVARMTVKGTGAGVQMVVSEERFYAAEAPYPLLETRFEQTTPLGSDVRRAVANAEGLVVTRVGPDGKTRERKLPATAENLAASLAMAPRDLDALPLGRSVRVSMFDWQTEKDQLIEVEPLRVETVRRSGVDTRFAVLRISYGALGLSGEATVGEDGIMLETTMGPGMVLRLEEQAVARGNIEGLDILGAGVKVDKRVANSTTARGLALRVLAKSGRPIPSAPNQQVFPPRPDGVVHVLISSGPGAPVTAEERPASLAPDSTMDADDATIVAAAAEILRGAGEGRAAQVQALVTWVHGALVKRLATHIPSASAVLAQKIGDCTEHTWLLVALARASGIPARPVYGLMYIDGTQPTFGYHAWAELEVDGRWLPVDPTWNQNPVDATHLALGHNLYDVAAAMGDLTIRVGDVTR